MSDGVRPSPGPTGSEMARSGLVVSPAVPLAASPATPVMARPANPQPLVPMRAREVVMGLEATVVLVLLLIGGQLYSRWHRNGGPRRGKSAPKRPATPRRSTDRRNLRLIINKRR